MKYVFATGNMRQFYGSVPEYSNAIKSSANSAESSWEHLQLLPSYFRYELSKK
jgi:hypothetical protein